MAIQIVGSRMRADAMYGQNGQDTPSSIQIGTPIKRSLVAQSIVEENHAKLPSEKAPDWQTRKIDASPIRPAPTMKNPNKSPAKIPGALLSRSVPPSVKPATKGDYKR
jgi:hypothetical protein